jgi:hypothetical protein
MKTSSLRVAALAILVSVIPVAAQTSAPPDRFFDSNGLQIRFVEQGAGPPVILLRGYTGTLDRHFAANGVLANIAKDHRAIAMDLRGHGKSGKPYDPELTRRARQGCDSAADHLKIQRAPSSATRWRGHRRPIVPRIPIGGERGVHWPSPGSGDQRGDAKFVEDSIRSSRAIPASLARGRDTNRAPMPSDAELRKRGAARGGE